MFLTANLSAVLHAFATATRFVEIATTAYNTYGITNGRNDVEFVEIKVFEYIDYGSALNHGCDFCAIRVFASFSLANITNVINACNACNDESV